MPNAQLAREQARTILAEGRFRSDHVPRPLHGILSAIGKAISAPLKALEELFSGEVELPGGAWTLFAVLAAIVLLICAAIAVRRSRRALAEPGAEGARGRGQARATAKDLEAAAEEAEREGRYADAVRLRFRAGLERLGESHVVARAASTPNAELSRLLSSERFDSLARSFDEIAYGGRAAGEQDASSARREWQALLRTRAHARSAEKPDVAEEAR